MTVVAIFTEDSYGIRFFKEFVARLKQEGVISKTIGIEVDRRSADCNLKFERIIEAKKYANRIIILADGDKWGGAEKAKKRAEIHVPKECKVKTKVIAFECNIEEWLCAGLAIKHRGKPIEALKKKCGDYEKSNLPRFVGKLDIKKLQKEQTFQNFLKELR